MNKYGAKVSPDYQDVSDVEDKDTSLHSDYNCMKVAVKGVYLIPPGTGAGIITIPHNLGRIPLPLVYLEDSDGYMVNALIHPFFGDFPSGIDAVNLYVQAYGFALSTRKISYFLFVDSGGF